MSGTSPNAELNVAQKTSEPTDIPEHKISDLKSVKVTEVKDLKVTVCGQEVTVAYRETKAEHPILDILFLHGMKYKSLTWVSEPVWTLQLLYRMGYRAVAIDLPGYGDSPKADLDPAAYIEAVIAALKLDVPVIISPSMSGVFSLPYLFKDPANVLSRSRGFVPVAPVGTDKYNAEQYKELKIPSLVIYGETDKDIGATAKTNLQDLPNRELVELKGAGHACYMDKPKEFHNYLVHFLKTLKK